VPDYESAALPTELRQRPDGGSLVSGFWFVSLTAQTRLLRLANLSPAVQRQRCLLDLAICSDTTERATEMTPAAGPAWFAGAASRWRDAAYGRGDYCTLDELTAYPKADRSRLRFHLTSKRPGSLTPARNMQFMRTF
jgi:hypothetical protein